MRPTGQEPGLRSPGGVSQKAAQPTVGRYVVAYALYFAILAGCYLNFVVWNSAVQMAAFAVVGRRLSLEAVYAFAMVLVITALFVVALWAEHSIRTAVARGEVRRVFVRHITRLLLAALVAVVITTVADRLAPV